MGFLDTFAKKLKQHRQDYTARKAEEEIHVLAALSFARNNSNMSYDEVWAEINRILRRYNHFKIARFIRMHAIQQLILDVALKKELSKSYILECIINSTNFVVTGGNFSDVEKEEAMEIKAWLE